MRNRTYTADNQHLPGGPLPATLGEPGHTGTIIVHSPPPRGNAATILRSRGFSIHAAAGVQQYIRPASLFDRRIRALRKAGFLRGNHIDVLFIGATSGRVGRWNGESIERLGEIVPFEGGAIEFVAARPTRSVATD